MDSTVYAPALPSEFESVLGAGAMINWITVGSGDVPLYEDWYNFQHLPERVSTPGFLRARRFIAADQPDPASLDYLTVYETEAPEVLASPVYLRRLDNPTDLTRHVVPLFRNFRRAACATTVVAGAGSSRRILAFELEARGDLTSLRSALRDRIFPSEITNRRIHAGSFYEPDAKISAAKNGTKEGQASSQQQADALLVLAELQTTADSGEIAADVLTALANSGDEVSVLRPPRVFDLLFELRAR
jgi:hypothetical protein